MRNNRNLKTKKTVFVCLSSLIVILIGTAQLSADTASSVSQYGITWNFNRAYEVGNFANGDYWVVGPVTITSITPAATSTRNGWEVNPTAIGDQGFDERANNFNAGLMPSLPYNASGGESIVKSISTGAGSSSPYLQTVAILTVLSSIPPGNGANLFRPGYCGSNKTFYYTTNLATGNLLSIETTDTGETFSYLNNRFKMPQIEIGEGSTNRRLRPVDNMANNYAPYSAGELNKAIAKLNGADSVNAKMETLIYVVQAGIDRYNAVLTGQTWPGGGGHQPGHKLSVAFAAYMLNVQGMKNAVSNTFWWENRLIRDALWGAESDEISYWDYVSDPPSSNREFADPYRYIDGGNNLSRLFNGYQRVTGNNTKGAACWLRYMPGMKEFWSDAHGFIAYAERWVNHGLKAKPDPCAPIHPNDVGRSSGNWSYYGVTWGPDGEGDCIKGNGRFNDGRDGIEADTGQYRSSQMNEMWSLFSEPQVQELHKPTGVTIILPTQ